MPIHRNYNRFIFKIAKSLPMTAAGMTMAKTALFLLGCMYAKQGGISLSVAIKFNRRGSRNIAANRLECEKFK